MLLDDAHAIIESSVNQHTKLTLNGMLSYLEYKSHFESLNYYTGIHITFTINSKLAFEYEGIITDFSSTVCEAKSNNAVSQITIEALSHTCLMDIERKSNSFQDKEMLYSEMISKIMHVYNGSFSIETVEYSKKLDTFVLQHDETDWTFLVREASKFEQGLYVDCRVPFPYLCFGTPMGLYRGDMDCYEYSVCKRLDMLRKENENRLIGGVFECDYTSYKIDDEFASNTFSLGDQVSYMGMQLYIMSVVSTIKDNHLHNTYELTTLNGLKQPRQYNKNIQGLALLGKVIAVKNNLLKLHLDIDSLQSVETAYWFSYTSPYSTWYCMPELNDCVVLNLPTKDESDAIAITSLKQNPSGGYSRDSNSNASSDSSGGATDIIDFKVSASDPDVKLFTTKSGRMIQFGPDRTIVLFDPNTYFILDDESGITLHTTQDISMHATGQINAIADNEIILSADTKITIRTKGSSIEIDPARISITSTDVRMN